MLLLLTLSMGLAREVQAQFFYNAPRFVAGGSAGQFRVSLDRYEEVYRNRWGTAYGWFGGVRVYSNVYITVAGRYFERDGKAEGSHSLSGAALSEAHWKERWYLIGVRRWIFTEKKLTTSIGLGYAFFTLQENPRVSVFELDPNGSGKQQGNGFFLALSLEYSLQRRLGLFGEIEITSAGVGGRSGFEALSIGGYFFSLGANVRLF